MKIIIEIDKYIVVGKRGPMSFVEDQFYYVCCYRITSKRTKFRHPLKSYSMKEIKVLIQKTLSFRRSNGLSANVDDYRFMPVI